jgi:hypothetical protein
MVGLSSFRTSMDEIEFSRESDGPVRQTADFNSDHHHFPRQSEGCSPDSPVSRPPCLPSVLPSVLPEPQAKPRPLRPPSSSLLSQNPPPPLPNPKEGIRKKRKLASLKKLWERGLQRCLRYPTSQLRWKPVVRHNWRLPEICWSKFPFIYLTNIQVSFFPRWWKEQMLWL